MKGFLRRFRTVRDLPLEERALFRQAFRLLLRVRLGMLLTSFPRVISWVRRQTPPIPDERISHPERLAWLVESIGYAFPGVFQCLPRALAGFILIRSCGWEVTLKIGMRRRRPDLPMEAHAWLEREGKILIGEMFGMEKFAVFETFGGTYL